MLPDWVGFQELSPWCRHCRTQLPNGELFKTKGEKTEEVLWSISGSKCVLLGGMGAFYHLFRKDLEKPWTERAGLRDGR